MLFNEVAELFVGKLLNRSGDLMRGQPALKLASLPAFVRRVCAKGSRPRKRRGREEESEKASIRCCAKRRTSESSPVANREAAASPSRIGVRRRNFMTMVKRNKRKRKHSVIVRNFNRPESRC